MSLTDPVRRRNFKRNISSASTADYTTRSNLQLTINVLLVRPKKSGGDRVKFSKINACLNLRNRASINSEPACSKSVRSFGDASSSEPIQPSLIYTSLYKPPLAGPTTIYTASLFLVEQREWLTPAQFNLCYSLSRVAPGTNLLAFCVAVGWVLLGRAGALVAVLSLSVPSALIVVALASLYGGYGQQTMILTITRWLLAATIGIIVASAWALVRPTLSRRRWFRSLVIVTGAFIFNTVLSISPFKILLPAAVVGFFWLEDKER